MPTLGWICGGLCVASMLGVGVWMMVVLVPLGRGLDGLDAKISRGETGS